MSQIARISISVEEELLKKFDSFSEEHGFPTRSEAIKNVMREALIAEEWTKGTHVAGTISLVYDHHKPGIVQKLLETQHDFCPEIQCSQHVHLDHNNCMEIIVLRGTKERIREILKQLRQIKGLKHVVLTMTTTGKHLH
ncbi:MAG: nickel-responsive transcriptional regulator NikR [Planctomycetaceae bacterium]|jgi:CopG family nickel-responsive transcriptional regulator|nr:nickel-responsive transcriptional regulator NikR [Planctomycetaceae bacterium]MDR1267985.1 nickel-responsive transcriptional regulator NikR [Planctomycetaceae bacterium]